MSDPIERHPTLTDERPNYKRRASPWSSLALALASMPVMILVSAWALMSIFNMLVAGYYPVPAMPMVTAIGVALFLRVALVVGQYTSDEERWYSARRTIRQEFNDKLFRITALAIAVGIAKLIELVA